MDISTNWTTQEREEVAIGLREKRKATGGLETNRFDALIMWVLFDKAIRLENRRDEILTAAGFIPADGQMAPA